MVLRLPPSLICFGLLLQAAAAQEAIRADKASDATIAAALRQLNLDFERQGAVYSFTLNGRPMELKSLQLGARLLLKAKYDKQASLEALNRYNEEQAVTTRAVRYAAQGVFLEAGLDCGVGVNDASVRRFLVGFDRDLKTFEQFLDGAASGPIPLRIVPGSDDKQLEITFPTDEPSPGETAWKIVWDMQTGEQVNKQGFRFPEAQLATHVIFRIKKAYYRPGPKAPWLQVLDDVHPSEFYVPYLFENTRFFDLRDVGGYVALNAHEGGPRSRLLGKEQHVMAEIRDRGLAYKHGNISRRGEEFVLWANFGAGNYTYFVEFCFHDDGTVVLKHAPTGYNYLAHFDEAAHMHNVLWRIGVRLGAESPGKRMATQVQLVNMPFAAQEQGPAGKLKITEVRSESHHDWNPKEFTRLRVTNPTQTLFPVDGKNPALPLSYDLVPTMLGQARHKRYDDEGFSDHDFWVTRADCPEKMYIHLHEYFRGKEYNGRVSSPKALAGSDGVVLWHMSSALHVPRGEDGILFGNNADNGQALVSWTQVELRPRNLFTKTPIYRTK